MSKFREIVRYLRLILRPEAYKGPLTAQGHPTGVVVSLTTLPGRIHRILPTIASLCDQSTMPDRIILNIPKYSKREKKGYNIPQFLKTHPLVHINESEEDLGPATKLLPTLKLLQRSDTLIIVADDDEIYPKSLIANYLKFTEQFPASVLTLVGWDAPLNFVHSTRTVIYGAIGSKPRFSKKVDRPTRVDCVQGASTYALRPGFLSNDVFDYSDAPQEAFFVDDIWISGHLAKENVPIYVLPANFRYARMKVLTYLFSGNTLHRKENKSGTNNSILYRFFEPFWPSRKGYSDGVGPP